MLRCLEYSLTRSGRNHADSDSDSGDSLFITQRPTPEAARTRRRDHPPSDVTPPEGGAERRAGPGGTAPKRGRRKSELPVYTFPFLSNGGRRGRRNGPRGVLLPLRNKTLNNFVMGGFFKCVRELQEGHGGEDDEDCPLPTVDMEGDYIPPLPEAEEMSADEDIRVVDKRCFVKPSKRNRRQTWCTRSARRRSPRVGNAGQETSAGAQNEMSNETPAEASTPRAAPSSLNTESAVDGGSSCGVLLERSEELATNDRNLLAPREARKTPTHHSQTRRSPREEVEEEELSYVSVCEPGEVHRGPRQSTQEDEEATAEPLNDALFMDDLSQIRAAEDELESQSIYRRVLDLSSDSEDGVGSDGDPECAEGGKDPSQGEPVGLRVAKSVSAKVQETPSMSEDSRSAKDLSGDGDKGDIPDSKQKKKKSTKSALEHFRREVDVNIESGESMEDSVSSVRCNLETVVKKKEKKRRRRDEDAEPPQSSAAVECLRADAETRRNMKRREKARAVIVGKECEEKEAPSKTSDVPPMTTEPFEESSAGLKSTAPSEETSESSRVKIKRHKKKTTQSSSVDVSQDSEEGVGESVSNDAAEGIGKKKKKKKRPDEGLDPLESSTATDPLMSKEQFEESLNGLENTGTLERGDVTRKKHKKRQQQSFSVDVSQDGEEGVGESLSNDAGALKEGTGKKKKKKKRHDDGLDPLESSPATDPLNDETQTKKGQRKKEEKGEEKEASDGTSDLPLMSKEPFVESVSGLENTGTLERGDFKRNKHKKRQQQAFSVDASQDGEEGVGVNVSSDAGSSKEGTPLKKKKKKRRKRHGEDVDP